MMFTSSSSSEEEDSRVIITPCNLRSAVWKHFGFWSENGEIVSKKRAICKLCRSELAYHSATSNLNSHLEHTHPTEHEAMLSTPPMSKQPRLDGCVPPPASSTASLPAAKQEACTKKLTKFLVKDMRPLCLAEGSGFREFCGEMEPRFRVPSRPTIASRVAKLYDVTRENLKKSVKDVRAVALTTDRWTSFARRAYVTVTAHWISGEWKMQDLVLKTPELRGSHTAEHVAECIKGVLGEFDIDGESVTAVSTDNALNYVNAVERHLMTTNIPCMAHTMNLAVRKGLAVGAIERPVSRLKLAAAHFNRSTIDNELLQAKQRMFGLDNEKLINGCLTRWNSTYDMICVAAKNQAAVSAVVFEKNLSGMELSAEEWTLMEEVRDALKPFKVATEAMSTDKYPTASAVLPLQHILISQLNKRRDPAARPEPEALREMKRIITTDLQKRYGHDSNGFKLLNKASYLDPRFHLLVHLNAGQKREVQEAIMEEMKMNLDGGTGSSEEPGTAGAEPSVQPTREDALPAMGDLFGDTYCTTNLDPQQDNERLLQNEMAMYEQEAPIKDEENPLTWWERSSGRFPNISKMARKYLGVPGTSVRSERVFSDAGNIVNKKRAALSSENVDKLVFLSNNL